MNRSSHRELEIPDIGAMVCIGKMWFSVLEGKPQEKVHYLVYEREGPDSEKGFAGICMEFGLYSWAESPDFAIAELRAIVEDHLENLLPTKDGRQQLFEERGETQNEGFWAIYRQLLFLVGDPEDARIVGLESELREERENNASLRLDIELLTKRFAERVGN